MLVFNRSEQRIEAPILGIGNRSAELMAESEDLELQRRAAPEGSEKRGE